MNGVGWGPSGVHRVSLVGFLFVGSEKLFSTKDGAKVSYCRVVTHVTSYFQMTAGHGIESTIDYCQKKKMAASFSLEHTWDSVYTAPNNTWNGMAVRYHI